MSKKTRKSAAEIVSNIRKSSGLSRRTLVRELCPCRTTQRDLEVWREIFRQARAGGRGERTSAAHTIATLMEKADTAGEWRKVLQDLSMEVDQTMADPRARSLILAQMKRHGHAHRGAAAQGYRRRRKVMELKTKEDLADWISDALDLPEKISAKNPGLDRLWRWQQHRIRFQPERRTKEAELLAKAKQFVS